MRSRINTNTRTVTATSLGWYRTDGMAGDNGSLTTNDILKYNRIILQYPEKSTNPTVSYGLIVYAIKTGSWVLVQRKHSAEFLVFIKGYYRLSHLPLLMCKFMPSEVAHIRAAMENIDCFSDLYSKILCQPSDGLSYAQMRFSEVLDVLPKLLSKINIKRNTLSWAWPKGRALITGIQKEDCLTAAKREFREEVEVDLPESVLTSDQCITEEYITIGGKLINAHYWLYMISEEFSIPVLDKHPEVRDRGWYSTTKSQNMLSDTLYGKATSLIAQHLDYLEIYSGS